MTVTKQQERNIGMAKTKIEHKFWADGIEQSLVGHKEDEFIDNFLAFVLEFGGKNNDIT